MSVSRRSFLAAAGAAAGAAVTDFAAAAPAAAVTFASNPFQLGSASGDPTEDSVILWTRLAPEPTATDFGMAGAPSSISVHWRVATTHEGATSDATSLYDGDVTVTATDCWSAHVDVKTAPGGGPLQAGTTYYFRFAVDGFETWVGTTRTRPAPDADVIASFAVISCQSYATELTGTSYWPGYTHLEQNPMDFVLHLGDYIYESSHANTIPAEIPGDPTTDACRSITDYRRRWGAYLERDNIQRVRRTQPMFYVPDDHEFINDVHGGEVADRTQGVIDRWNNALRALWENMPTRSARPVVEPGTTRLVAEVERTDIRWGRHLDLIVPDMRQYRTRFDHATPTLFGVAQRNRVLNRIATASATWTALGVVSPITSYRISATDPRVAGTWNTYAERGLVTDAIAARRASDPDFSPVFLAGDVHCGYASRVARDQDVPEQDHVATEFSVPSMSSYGTASGGTGRTSWPDRRAGNPTLLSYIGIPASPNEDDGSGYAKCQPYKGYLRCAAGPDYFYTNYITATNVWQSTSVATSRKKLRVTRGAIGALPY
ncbi:Alkaline phosphatase [Beutenbergia cavernae DSM 12333]|uniref:Alkaline phosphatase n=2 Tax=Beutenbergia TaxID=84756 RepID=C5C359_BEUC1|nr:Alkaline phosphatase [Beutenbergia cavernae DSM 12333]